MSSPRAVQTAIRHIVIKPPVLLGIGVLIFATFTLLVNYFFVLVGALVVWLRDIIAHQDGTLPALMKAPSFFTLAPLPTWGFVVILSLAAFIAIRFTWKIWKNLYVNSDDADKGSRRWTTLDELRAQYPSIPDSKKEFPGSGGVPISRYGNQLFIDRSPVNNLIIGTTRSGKGEVFVVSMIDIYSRCKDQKDRASLIVRDPKGELFAASKETLEKRGYRVAALDLVNFRGMQYNPLEIIVQAYMSGEIAEAQMLARSLAHILYAHAETKDPVWEDWSIALASALILAHVIDCCATASIYQDPKIREEELHKINMYSVARLLIDLMNSASDDDSGSHPIDRFFSSRSQDDIARIQYAAVAGSSEKTKGNIFAHSLSQLAKFTLDNIAKLTAANTFPLEDIGFDMKQPTALFLITPDYDTSNNFLPTILITQLYFILSKRASNSPGGKCAREVVFLLDEFGTDAIPGMGNMSAVCLGRNIRFTLIVQAYSQIYKLYGEKDAETIIGNCGNQIYLLTIEKQTAELFSALIGSETITIKNTTGDELSFQKQISEHVESKPLLNANELMELKEGECVVVRVTKRRDLKGEKITPTPIFNTGKTAMRYRYEYLADEFDTSRSLQEIFADVPPLDIELNDILYRPENMFSGAAGDIETKSPAPYFAMPSPPIGYYDNRDRIYAVYSAAAGDAALSADVFYLMTVSEVDGHIQQLADVGQITSADTIRIQELIQGGHLREKAL